MSGARWYWFIFQVPCIIMVEVVDSTNLYIAVSSPNLNFNITRELEVGSQVNGQERFYSVSMPVEIQVIWTNTSVNLTGITFILFIKWLALQAGKKNQVLRCDWLPKWVRWGYIARLGLPLCPAREMFFMPYNKSFIDLTKFGLG